MKGKNKMKNFGYVLMLISTFLLIGTVGGIEHGTMQGASGIIWSGIFLALMFIAIKIIERYEENEK
jgi:hypothetical protein